MPALTYGQLVSCQEMAIYTVVQNFVCQFMFKQRLNFNRCLTIFKNLFKGAY